MLLSKKYLWRDVFKPFEVKRFNIRTCPKAEPSNGLSAVPSAPAYYSLLSYSLHLSKGPGIILCKTPFTPTIQTPSFRDICLNRHVLFYSCGLLTHQTRKLKVVLSSENTHELCIFEQKPEKVRVFIFEENEKRAPSEVLHQNRQRRFFYPNPLGTFGISPHPPLDFPSESRK